MKRLLVLFFILHCSIASADWQEDLEAVFEIVHTFDNIEDWDGGTSAHDGYDNVLANQPKLASDGSDTIWRDFSSEAAPVTDFIKTREAEYMARGTGKSLCMNGPRYPDKEGVAQGYGPGKISMYFGDGDRMNGYETIHIFHQLKFHTTKVDLSSAPYVWVADGDMWYLTSNNVDPDLLEPTELRANGVWMTRENAGQVPDNIIGDLALGEWGYGDNGVGYNTMYMRMPDGSDPNATAVGALDYKLTPFNMEAEDDPTWVGTFKYTEILTGFDSVWDWGETGLDADVNPNDQHQKVYGLNSSILNIMSTGTELIFKDQVNTALWVEDDQWYRYYDFIDDRQHPNADFSSSLFGGQWIGYEIKISLGTLDQADGSIETFMYDEDGNLIGYDGFTGELHRAVFDDLFNKVSIGGNRLGTSYEEDASDPRETRFYIDDVIIHSAPIADSYYAMRAGNNPPGITGECGAAADTPPVIDPPTTNLCNAGTPTAVTTGATEYTWQCLGSESGTNADCSVEIYNDPGPGGTIIRGWQWPDTKHLIRLP